MEHETKRNVGFGAEFTLWAIMLYFAFSSCIKFAFEYSVFLDLIDNIRMAFTVALACAFATRQIIKTIKRYKSGEPKFTKRV